MINRAKEILADLEQTNEDFRKNFDTEEKTENACVAEEKPLIPSGSKVRGPAAKPHRTPRTDQSQLSLF